MSQTLESADILRRRIDYKKNARRALILTWTTATGMIFYFIYSIMNIYGLALTLSLTTFIVHIGIGFSLKTPSLLNVNIFFYPFGIIISIILNYFSPRWSYDGNPVGFAFIGGVALFLMYVLVLLLSSSILKRLMGFETTTENPITSHSFRLKSLNRDPVRLLEERLDIIKDAQQATIRRDNQHRIKFLINPNIYEIVFSPISEEFIEVNLFAYRIESDIIRDPDGKESDVLVSVLNAVFKTWVKQGVIDYWEAEDSPTYSENIRNSLFNTYANASKIIVFEPLRRIRHMSIDWLTRNWKQIVATVIIIILTAVLTPIIQRSLFDPHSP